MNKFRLDHPVLFWLITALLVLFLIVTVIWLLGQISAAPATVTSDNPAFAKATQMVKEAQSFAATATAVEEGRVALDKAAEEAAILKGLPTATATPAATSTPAATATLATPTECPEKPSENGIAYVLLGRDSEDRCSYQAIILPPTPTPAPTLSPLEVFNIGATQAAATAQAMPPTSTPAPAAPAVQAPAQPAAPAVTSAPVISSGSGIFTEIHPLQDDQCQPLSSGQPMVWKDYVRDAKMVRIYAHDGKGELGSEICRGVTDWGWRVPWDGMETYEGAQKYAMEEAWRVMEIIDANPAFPQGDPVIRIEVYYLTELVWVYPMPTATPTP